VRVYNRALTPSGTAGDSEKRIQEPTNQKLRFDVDLGGRWLGVGDQVRSVAKTLPFDLTESVSFRMAIFRCLTWIRQKKR
jgi:hypothetical protein